MKKPRPRTNLPLLTWRPPLDPETPAERRPLVRTAVVTGFRILLLVLLVMIGFEWLLRKLPIDPLPLPMRLLMWTMFLFFPLLIFISAAQMRFGSAPRRARRFQMFDNRIPINDKASIWFRSVRWWRVIEMAPDRLDRIEVQTQTQLHSLPLPTGRRREQLVALVRERAKEFDPRCDTVLKPDLSRIDELLLFALLAGGTVLLGGMLQRLFASTPRGPGRDWIQLLLYFFSILPGISWYWLRRNGWNTAQRNRAKGLVCGTVLLMVFSLMAFMFAPGVKRLLRELEAARQGSAEPGTRPVTRSSPRPPTPRRP